MPRNTEPQNRWHKAMNVYFCSGVSGSAGQFCWSRPRLRVSAGLAAVSCWGSWGGLTRAGLGLSCGGQSSKSVNKALGFSRPGLSLLPHSVGQSKSPDRPRSGKDRRTPSRAGGELQSDIAGDRDGGTRRTGASFAISQPHCPLWGCLASLGASASRKPQLPHLQACAQSRVSLVLRTHCTE